LSNFIREQHFNNKIGKGKEKTQSGGFKFFNKVSHVAWDKFKGPRLNAKSPVGRSISPQQSIATKNEGRDTSNDIDVFGMDLKSATIKTRIMQDKKNGAAVYWIPALAYRCLQYVIILSLAMCFPLHK
jgi:hypothetical protein